MAVSSVQGTMKNAVREAGIHKKGVSIHTLRHSYAPPICSKKVLTSGSSRSFSADTTLISLHLTQKGHEDAYALINNLMTGLHGLRRASFTGNSPLKTTSITALSSCPNTSPILLKNTTK